MVTVRTADDSFAAWQYPTALRVRWRQQFDDVLERLGPLFPRRDARSNARAYLEGLLAPVERKNGWQLAEAIGDLTPYALQHVLGRAVWQADAARDELRRYVVATLGDPEGILVLDETGFLKKGDKSVGVQRQYSGTAGRIENCQVGVFLAYVTPKGRTFVDRALYLPQSWLDDRERCRRAGVPEGVGFATKPELGRRMLAQALEAGVACGWVTADEVYGSDSKLRRFLQARPVPFVLAVARSHGLRVDFEHTPVAELARRLSPNAWHRLSAGAGSKGPRSYDWALWPFSSEGPTGWQNALLVRRSVSDPTELAFYLTFAPPRTTLQTLAHVAGQRWGIEESLPECQGRSGAGSV